MKKLNLNKTLFTLKQRNFNPTKICASTIYRACFHICLLNMFTKLRNTTVIRNLFSETYIMYMTE